MRKIVFSMAESNYNERRPSTRLQNPLLASYFQASGDGRNDQSTPSGDVAGDCMDVDKMNFDPELYKRKLFKECPLSELIDRRAKICKQIVELDSEMKTLVYENYNKFISATDTIHKMKNDFEKMEDEMDKLATNMSAITEFSSQISGTLQDRRQQINKLSSVHSLLMRLQFLFELPSKLNKCIEDGAYSQVVKYHVKAQQVLHQYQHMPSFQGIHKDCDAIVAKLKTILRNQFHDQNASPKQLAESINLLLQLNEPVEELWEEYLANAQGKLDRDLSELDFQVRLQGGEVLSTRPADTYLNVPLDILAFVDLGCNKFLTDICLIVAAYQDMFLHAGRVAYLYGADQNLKPIATKKLVDFVESLMGSYFSVVQQRVEWELKGSVDNNVLVRALDRFHNRLQSLGSLMPNENFERVGIDIVSQAGRGRCLAYLDCLKQDFSDCVTDVRQALASGRPNSSHGTSLLTLRQGMIDTLVGKMRAALVNLQTYMQPDIEFATKPYFRENFCARDIREGFVVAFLHHVNHFALEFCNEPIERRSVPPPLLLLLSRICLDFESSTVSEMVNLAESQFSISPNSALTPVSELCAESKNVAQNLLNLYVRVQGLTVSQMLRKSVETRDWINTIEPRMVRAVMKRVVEDITFIDSQVGQVYEEGSRRERSSDSSRRALSAAHHSASLVRQNLRGSTWSSYAPSTLDDNLMSNIHKLFFERIEIFASVDFSKVSILTGIVKISLKTLLECVRLRTFGRYGLQQIQVDTYYLKEYLWRFVNDEQLVDILLDEILSSSIHRCVDPVLMETSIVKAICERG